MIDQQVGVYGTESGHKVVSDARVVADESGYAVISAGDVMENSGAIA